MCDWKKRLGECLKIERYRIRKGKKSGRMSRYLRRIAVYHRERERRGGRVVRQPGGLGLGLWYFLSILIYLLRKNF
jgi:hypothetical protein